MVPLIRKKFPTPQSHSREKRSEREPRVEEALNILIKALPYGVEVEEEEAVAVEAPQPCELSAQ